MKRVPLMIQLYAALDEIGFVEIEGVGKSSCYRYRQCRCY